MAVLPIAAPAATFTLNCDGQFERVRHGCTVRLTGEIQAGDATRLLSVTRAKLPPGWHYSTLLLDSNGGNVAEAFKLAEVIRQLMLRTSTRDLSASSIGEDYPCVSACFLVWIAGTERDSLSYRSKSGMVGLGLHRPYFSADAYNERPEAIAEKQQEMTETVRRYLQREQVPQVFIDKMMQRSSREVYWINESGDAGALKGRAAWFEEMMIARCNLDPSLDNRMDDLYMDALRAGKTPSQDRQYQLLLAERQSYNTCEYRQRQLAQSLRSR